MSRQGVTLLVHMLAVAYLMYIVLSEIFRVIPAKEWIAWLAPAVLILVAFANQRRKHS